MSVCVKIKLNRNNGMVGVEIPKGGLKGEDLELVFPVQQIAPPNHPTQKQKMTKLSHRDWEGAQPSGGPGKGEKSRKIKRGPPPRDL